MYRKFFKVGFGLFFVGFPTPVNKNGMEAEVAVEEGTGVRFKVATKTKQKVKGQNMRDEESSMPSRLVSE